jgi:hypothetical protein
LFTLLVSFSLIHRIILIVGIMNLTCVPFSAYFLTEYDSGLSVMESLVLIYLLLTIWAFIELIRPVLKTRIHPAQALSTRLIHAVMFLLALFSLIMTLKALPITEDIVYHREINQEVVQNDSQREFQAVLKSRFCTLHVLDR